MGVQNSALAAASQVRGQSEAPAASSAPIEVTGPVQLPHGLAAFTQESSIGDSSVGEEALEQPDRKRSRLREEPKLVAADFAGLRDLKMNILQSALKSAQSEYTESKNKTSFRSQCTPEQLTTAFNVAFRLAAQSGLAEKKSTSNILVLKSPPEDKIQFVLDKLKDILKWPPTAVERVRQAFENRPINYVFDDELYVEALSLAVPAEAPQA